jgi:ubiquinone/menaquinone biosynthesis C-methylase UbiE
MLASVGSVSDADALVANGYNAFYASWGRSPALRRIWRDNVTGPDYPEAFAHISFLPLAELRALTAGLDLADDQVLVDLACGAGGPGLWAARETGARLVGRDLSPIAVDRARERASALGMAARAQYAQGTFADTGLASTSADAVMTVDALQYAPDKRKALTEVARIVRPGGRFAFVAFELDAEQIADLPVWSDPVGDYRPLLEKTGFEVLEYEQIPHWEEQVAAGFGAVLAERETLAAELGEAAAAAMLMEASITLELHPYCGHVRCVTRRT